METVCLQSELDSVEVAEPQEIQTYHRCNILAFLKRNLFVILTVTAVASGIGLGFALRSINMSDRDVRYLMFPGELLLRLLQMLMLPLIVSSLISGTSSVDRKAYGRIGLRAICYYLLTTLIAAFTGIILAVIIQPGNWSRNTSASSGGHAEAVQTVDAILDLIRNMIPSNLVEACFRKFKTVYSRSDSTGFNITEAGENNNTVPVPGSSDGMNMLGLLVFSVAFGLILGGMGSQGKPLRDFFDCLNTAVMSLVNIFIWYSPVGILFLMAGQVVKMTDMGEIGLEVGMYTLTVIAGLLIHSFLTLPLIYFSVTRKNPFRFMSGVLQALATAFGTSSSSATLPVTLHCMEVNHSMDTRVTRFLLPTGATMNMDGAALYEAVAALFIAQLHNMNFGLGQIIVLSLIVTASSTGGAGIPQAGLVTMMIVLSSAGLPTENISLLIMVDWILDRLRTTTNVLGDCIGVGVVQHLSRRELQSSEPAGESLMEENLHL
ncbi:excitatory amino acid transporter 1-like isoform X2 [Limanda limanda]|uniref:excitatory amino acid transporter 1-like isoform X2 n=1 Tax=Limanda limanda TaxID=27771 RepID=UPI0029C71A3E|nr:excitatory amino acid transporter 1-like isoform X2 [Limanda limanda]